jgi:hypothetical protein
MMIAAEFSLVQHMHQTNGSYMLPGWRLEITAYISLCSEFRLQILSIVPSAKKSVPH